MKVSAHFLEVYCSVHGIDNTPHHLVNFRIKSAEKANLNFRSVQVLLSENTWLELSRIFTKGHVILPRLYF